MLLVENLCRSGRGWSGLYKTDVITLTALLKSAKAPAGAVADGTTGKLDYLVSSHIAYYLRKFWRRPIARSIRKASVGIPNFVTEGDLLVSYL